MPTFVKITPDNWRAFTRLSVSEEQRGQVAPNVAILARAYAYRHEGSRVQGIQQGGQPIGLLLQREYAQSGLRHVVLDQFMIAHEHQGQGHGTEVMHRWLGQVRAQQRYDRVILCYKRDSAANRRFYERFGFMPSGVVDGDEIVMELPLSPA